MSTDREKKTPEHLQLEADRVKPRQKVTVLSYLTILFAAAFLLLLLSYLMQQRNNQEVISGLKESVSAMQSIENLQTEKNELTDQAEQLQQQLDEAKKGQREVKQTNETLQLQVDALDWLREIQALYAKKYYKAARTMIADFEGTGLVSYLPGESLHSYNGEAVLSPKEQYNSIVDALE